jgi:hypothetical protein
MINRSLKTSLVLLPGILMTTMLIAIFAGASDNSIATGQTGNATSATNQTSPRLGNLTVADFLPVQDSLSIAREAIFDNGNSGTYTALNEADNDLYTLVELVGPEVEDLFLQQIAPVREKINAAQEAVVNGDFATALQNVNSASTELVKITLQLPSGEVEE